MTNKSIINKSFLFFIFSKQKEEEAGGRGRGDFLYEECHFHSRTSIYSSHEILTWGGVVHFRSRTSIYSIRLNLRWLNVLGPWLLARVGQWRRRSLHLTSHLLRSGSKPWVFWLPLLQVQNIGDALFWRR